MSIISDNLLKQPQFHSDLLVIDKQMTYAFEPVPYDACPKEIAPRQEKVEP